MTNTPGKLRGLQAISDRGVVKALALDQRGSLAAMMAGASGREPSAEMLREFKRAITQKLTPDASAILLDRESGEQVLSSRASGTGLILTYEKDSYVNRSLHRMPELISGATVRSLKEAGADCIKVLVHYCPYAGEDINDSKQLLVERVGIECASEDVPFLLEVLGYDSKGANPQTFQYAVQKPEIVRLNIVEFSNSRYAVDLLKVEFPVNMQYVSGSDSFQGKEAYSRSQALKYFRQAAQASQVPFVYLSAGVSHAEFLEALNLAGEGRVPYSGVLCGRAIWQDGARVYSQAGLAGLESWIENQGRTNLQRVISCLDRAQPIPNLNQG